MPFISVTQQEVPLSAAAGGSIQTVPSRSGKRSRRWRRGVHLWPARLMTGVLFGALAAGMGCTGSGWEGTEGPEPDDDTRDDSDDSADEPSASNPGYSLSVMEQPIASGSLRQSALAWDEAAGSFVAVWGTVPDTFHVSAATLTPGSPLAVGPEVRVDETVYDGGDPEVAADGLGHVLVVFADDRLGNGNGLVDIYAQVLESGTLAPLGANFRVSGTDATNDWNPAVAWDRDTFLVAWGDDRNYSGDDRRQLWARTVGVDQTLGEATLLGPESSYWQVLPSIAGSGGNGLFLVVWGDYDLVDGGLNAGYRARVVDTSGQAVSEVITLVRFGDQLYDRPAVAWSPPKQAWLVAWMEPYALHVSWVTEDGVVSGGDEWIAPDTGAGAPRLAWSPATNSFALAYHAWWTTQGFMQELDADASLSGEPHLLTSTEPPLGTFWQPIAASPDAEFLALPVLDYSRMVGTSWVR